MKTKYSWLWIALFMLCTTARAGVVVVLNPLEAGAGVSADAANDVLQAELSRSGAITLVDRERLHKILDELKLGQQGMIPPESARELGKIAGARYFVSGYIRKAGEQTMGTIKVIDAETTLIKTGYVMMTGETDPVKAGTDLARQAENMVLAFEKDLANRTVKAAASEKTIPADWKRPVVMLVVGEKHLPGRETYDPAGETEIMKRLINAGFKVIDAEQVTLAKKAAADQRGYQGTIQKENADTEAVSSNRKKLFGSAQQEEKTEAKAQNQMTAEMTFFKGQEKSFSTYAKTAGADVVILGEAISEFGGQLGDFEGCRARIELKALDAKTEQVLCVDSATAGATDLAEQIAGKKAIQLAANTLADSFLYELAKKWNQP